MKQYKDSLLSALKQEARRHGMVQEKIEKVASVTRALVEMCGEQSRSRQMMQRIGSVLLTEGLRVIAPACPDYAHKDGQYTFRGIGGGVPLLVELQIRFLERISQLIPDLKATILLADHETDDQALCAAVGKSREEFLCLVNESILLTQARVDKHGWEARAMTSLIPNLVCREKEEIEKIRADSNLGFRIASDTIFRRKMYLKIASFTAEEMVERTLRTAAQYRVMAQFVRDSNFLVCNHSTVNLVWYREAGAAVLHNPVSVY